MNASFTYDLEQNYFFGKTSSRWVDAAYRYYIVSYWVLHVLGPTIDQQIIVGHKSYWYKLQLVQFLTIKLRII